MAVRGRISTLLLILSKFYHVFSIFLAYECLTRSSTIAVIVFLFIHQFIAASCFNFFQKPLTGKVITTSQWLYILRHGLIASVIQFLLFTSLCLCGPLRTLLVYEQSELVVLSVVTSMLCSYKYKNSNKIHKGSFLFTAATVSLLLFDKDSNFGKKILNRPDDHDNFFVHGLYILVSWFGLSYQIGGVILILLTLFLNTAFKIKSKRLAFDLGDSKRLHALSITISTIFLFIFTLFITISNLLTLPTIDYTLFLSAIMASIGFVFDFYTESFSRSQLDASDIASYGFCATIIAALFFGSFWNLFLPLSHSLVINKSVIDDISGGVFLSILLFYMATKCLITPILKLQGLKGSLVGYNENGLPIFINTSAQQQTVSSISTFVKNTLTQIFMEQESRQIFYFLCFNLTFTIIELIFGVWTNSLGLISDGFHMLFDCTALVMGLIAAIMSKWGPSSVYSFGFGRVEVLSGFVNSLFLVLISFFVFATAIFRLCDPPEIKTDNLLAVSIGGLFVNLFGIFTFRHHHHGHFHSGHNHHNANLEGVFLHVLADTLGSLGVIVSSLLVDQFDIFVADPICSIFISILIFISTLPLLNKSSLILLQYTDPQLENIIYDNCNTLLLIEGVKSYSKMHFWNYNTGAIVGTIHIQITSKAKEQKILSKSQNIFRRNLSVLTIQIEKEEFIQQLNRLVKSYKITSHLGELPGIFKNTSKNFIQPI